MTRSFSSPVPQPGPRLVCPTVASSPRQVGNGLSTYLAPLKCLLLGAEVSILWSSPQLQGLWRPMGSAQAGWADQPLPHPTPGTQDWRLAEGGASVATSMGGECSNVGAGGLGLSPQQEAVEGPSAGTLVQAGRLWQTLCPQTYTLRKASSMLFGPHLKAVRARALWGQG